MAETNTGGSSEETISAYFVFFSFLLALTLVLSKLLHDSKKLSNVLPEAGMILLVGMTAGFCVHWWFGDERIAGVRGMEAEQQQNDDDGGQQVDYEQLAQNVLSFSPDVFFVALLPPIIFNGGYHLRRELFFRHIVPIALLAIAGTLLSALIIAFFLELVTFLGLNGDFRPTLTELLTFGALISATDPVSTLAVFQAKRVDPQLFYLVFGESCLNDAVGLVLFETFCKFVMRDNGAGKIAMGVFDFVMGFLLDSVASPLLGWICAIGAALLFKHMDFRSNKLLELSIYLLIMYVPFLVAEVLELSGIVTILVTGVAAKHYVEPNLSELTQDTADVIFRLAAHLAETSIFLELGLSVFGVTEFLMWRFILWSLLACLMARACHVYPIAVLFNQSLQKEQPCNIWGYRLREGIDGIMKMECGQADSNKSNSENSSNNNDVSTNSSSSSNQNKRKHKGGNQELKEHLNDFSNPNPIERCDSKESTSSRTSQQSHASQREREKQPQESPPHRSITHGDSIATLTPIQKRDMKIRPKTAHMLWFSGLRGAVAYACVRSFPDTFDHQKQFMSTTMMIVLITVFIMGGATEKMLHVLDIETDVNENQYMEAWRQSEQAPKPGFWHMIDERFVQKYVIRDYDTSTNDDTTTTKNGNAASEGKGNATAATTSSNDNSNNRRDKLRRIDQSSRSTTDNTPSGIEMTESGHYDTLHEMGASVPASAKRKPSSLFDFGMSKTV